MTNLLISGIPRSGKTTLIKKLLQVESVGKKSGGFFTEEILQEGVRIGFNIVTVPERRKGLLAKKGFSSSCRVGKYGVNITTLEELGCQAILRARKTGHTIIIDEIGKMELFSEKFRSILTEALDSPQKVVATIMERSHEFSDHIKKRPDAWLFFLERKNFETVFQTALNWLDKA